ncbi:hypothetical protein OROMI_033209 [Orobanche minor]
MSCPIPSTSNVSSHTMLSMSWGASTVRERAVSSHMMLLVLMNVQRPRFWCNSHHTLLGQPTEIPKPSFAACCATERDICTGDKVEIQVLNASGIRHEFMDLKKD